MSAGRRKPVQEDMKMSEFDKIIGYESIKEELRQLCDMIHNKDVYERLGAQMPKGLLIHGEPGVGKSLMARSFISESGMKSYIIRRNKHDGDFIDEIKNVFTDAAQNTPSVILLDDMDKFVVEEDSREEYVAVQACIDEVHFSDVYVLATANELYGIPDSLLRAGRFDRKIEVKPPEGEDALKIIRYFIDSKPVVGDLNIDDIAKMLHGRSCAELETILNEAAIYAGFERSEDIATRHIVRSVLRNEYGESDSFLAVDSSRLERIAYHEAGHVVISEILHPNNIGLASLRTRGRKGRNGFVVRCADWNDPSHDILMSLAGKAATELKYGTVPVEGSSNDIERAINAIAENVVHNAACGIGALDVSGSYEQSSDILRAKQEGVIHAEMERYLAQAKELLTKNRDFLDAAAAALLEKDTLLNSDILRIRAACEGSGSAL
jgi:cell division protease FtsH